MKLLRRPWLRMLCALFACFVIAGDIVADGLHDASGACASDACTSESQNSGHDSCPACGCAIHGGSAALSEPAAFLIGAPQRLDSIALRDVLFAPGTPRAIDHPPQLS